MIIVFVAVGLLIGAFAALIIVRRVPQLEPMPLDTDGGWLIEPGRPVPLGEEPKLFNMSAGVDEKALERGYVWRDIMVSHRPNFVRLLR